MLVALDTAKLDVAKLGMAWQVSHGSRRTAFSVCFRECHMQNALQILGGNDSVSLT
jgi:hypothetical protein